MGLKINPYGTFKSYLSEGLGLRQYELIIHNVHMTDVSSDTDYQSVYNSFYGIRRDTDWRKQYYEVFEGQKARQHSFDLIITELYNRTGRVEASFASKMCATIDPDMPIWDSHVLSRLGLKTPNSSNPEKRLQQAINIYEKIRNWYNEYLRTDNARECIDVFDKYLPEYSWISDTKKIDYFLWM